MIKRNSPHTNALPHSLHNYKRLLRSARILSLLSCIVLSACTVKAPDIKPDPDLLADLHTDSGTELGTELGTQSGMDFDEIAPRLNQWMKQPAILVFSKTQGWRHDLGIAGADNFFSQLSREQGYDLFTTVNAAVFNPDDLARFDVVVFNNMTGDALSPEQELVFQTWLENGGAWIGVHGAGDASHSDWEWYEQSLIGPVFIGHPMKPQFKRADIVTLAPAHPVMESIPARWSHIDEWYSFDSRPQDYGLSPLAGLDEATLWPQGERYDEGTELRMGSRPEQHPIMWSGCPRKGRSFYSALGHNDDAYHSVLNRKVLENAFNWVQKKSDPQGEHCPKRENATGE